MKSKMILVFAGLVALTCVRTLAQTTIINFDALTPGTVVKDQFAGDVTFSGPANVVVQDPLNLSYPNALSISESCCEEAQSLLLGYFTVPDHNFVRVTIGAAVNSPGGTAILRAFDSAGNLLASSSTTIATGPSDEGWTYLEVSTPEHAIASFMISGSAYSFLRIDNLEFDLLGQGTSPDFYFDYDNARSLVLIPAGWVPGESGTRSLGFLLIRTHNSQGAINFPQFQPGSLPPGVTGDIFPTSSSNPNGDYILVTLTASSSATPVANFPVTLTGVPSSSQAGMFSHSITFPVSVVGTYDFQVINMEVTQGVQPVNLQAVPNPGGTQPASAQYSGVDLISGKITTVRVFAAQLSCNGPSNPQIPPQTCLLYGYDQFGSMLPESPLVCANIYGTYPQGVCAFSGGYIPGDQRLDNRDFRFVLPRAWTMLPATSPPSAEFTQPISLKAVLQPNIINNQFTPPPPPWVPCCPGQGDLLLTGIQFFILPTPPQPPGVSSFNGPLWHQIFPCVVQDVNNGQVNTPDFVLAATLKTWPVDEIAEAAPNLFSGPQIDVTDLWHGTAPEDLLLENFLHQTLNPTVSGQFVNGRVMGASYSEAFSFTGGGFHVGIYPSTRDGSDNPFRSTTHNNRHDFHSTDTMGAVFEDNTKFLSSAAHEMGHYLGRPHAGLACGAQNLSNGCAERWETEDPNNTSDVAGHLLSYGFDRDTGQVHPTTDFDLMTYCNYLDDSITWISQRGWEEALWSLSYNEMGQGPINVQCGTGTAGSFEAALSSTGVPASVPVASGSMLLVTCLILDTNGTGLIQWVLPSDVTRPGAQTNSPATLIVRDAQSNTLATVPMWFELTHVDDAPLAGFVHAYVPTDNVASVEVTWNGVSVDKRIRSPNPPVVQITGVQSDVPGNRTNGPTVTIINWTATDADHDPLMTKVDYSTNNGLSWQNVFFGPDRGRLSLPSSSFAFAREARVRIRVSDGFNETRAISWPFAAAGAPPVVRIISPVPGRVFGNEESLHCAGTAFDDRGQAIQDNSVWWYAGRKFLGQGRSVSVQSLPPCSQTLTLVARDYLGRMGSASVTVNLTQKGVASQLLINPALLNTNIACWLTADTGVQVGSNGLVSAWADQSGLGFDAFQTNAANQPFYLPNALRGRPALQFGPGSNQFLTVASQIITSQQFTIIAVVSDQATNPGTRIAFSSMTNGLAPNPVNLGVAPGSLSSEAVVSSGAFGAGAGIFASPTRLSVLSAVVDNGPGGSNTASVYQNRRLIATANLTPGITNNLFGPYAIGRQAGDFSNTYWQGQVAELLVYNAALSSSELQQVYDYLQAKYTVLPGVPQINSIRVTNNTVFITFTTQDDRPYVLQSTGSLAPPPVQWVTVTNVFPAVAPSTAVVPDPISGGQRFYRLVVPGQ